VRVNGGRLTGPIPDDCGVSVDVAYGDIDLGQRDTKLWHTVNSARTVERFCDACNHGGAIMRSMAPVSGSRTLLIVDDSPAVCSAVAAYMSSVADWDAVLIAPSAGSGLELATEHHPVAIVLDNQMPGGDGIEVLHELRAACPDARIVMHTSEESWVLRERARDLGADAFVAKGSPLDELASTLTIVA
jgi:CheY-like chemotaxis protein